MENKFGPNTLGFAALNMLSEIKDKEGKVVSYCLTKTAEVKAVLAAQEARGANTLIGVPLDGTLMQSVGIEAAIQAYLNSQLTVTNNPLAGKPIIDYYRVIGAGDDILIACSIAKSLSANMSLIKDGTLSSTRLVSVSSNNQTNNKAGLKDKLVRENLPQFSARADNNNGDIVTKTIDISNVEVGCPLDFGDLYDYDTLNFLISCARMACEEETIAAYENYGNTYPNDKGMYLTALRLQNRDALDSMFEDVFTQSCGEPDINNKEQFSNFIMWRKRFHGNLSRIGSGNNVSPYTHRLGIERIDIVTSPKQEVRSAKRVGSVKKNEVGSYVHIKPQDTGICTAVFSDKTKRDGFVKNYAGEWMRTAAIWFSNESRHMVGLPTEEIPDELMTKLSKTAHTQATTAELLKINPSDIGNLQDEFINKAYDLSTKIVEEERLQLEKNYLDSLQDIDV